MTTRLRSIFLLLGWLILFSQVALGRPFSVKEQVVDGRLITEWGTFDSLDLYWLLDSENDTPMYLGSTVADLMADSKSGEDSPPTKSYFVLGLPLEGLDSKEQRQIVESHISNFGTVNSKSWKTGSRPFLAFHLADGSSGAAATVPAGKGLVLVIGLGLQHSEKDYRRFLESFKDEDTKEALAKSRSSRKITRGDKPGEFQIDGVAASSNKVESGLQKLGAGTIVLPDDKIWTQMTMDLGEGSTSLFGFGEEKCVTVSTLGVAEGMPMTGPGLEAFAEAYLKGAYDARDLKFQLLEKPFPNSLEVRWTVGTGTALAQMLDSLIGKESSAGVSLVIYASGEVIMVSAINEEAAVASQILATYVPAAGVEVGVLDRDPGANMETLLFTYLKAHLGVLILLPILIGIRNRITRDQKLNPWWTTALVLAALLLLLMGGISWENRDTFSRAVNLFSSGAFWKPVAVVSLAPMLLYFRLGWRWNRLSL